MRKPALILLFAAALTACGGEQPAEPAAEATPKPATEASPAGPAVAAIPRTPSPDGARVFFITPADGDTVSSPVSIEFGVEGMSVVRAGEQAEAAGHHHLIIDAELPPLGAPIPADANYRHFGDASTSTQIELEPGTHTLQLLLGDHIHVPHDPAVFSDVITITVE